MNRPEVVPLTHEHLVEFHGENGRGPTVKGIAAFLDGKLIAVAGFALQGGKVIAFCDLKEEARPFKASIHRTALELLSEAKQRHRRILAYCDENEPGAPKWLRRLGFRSEDNGVWTWQTSA